MDQWQGHAEPDACRFQNCDSMRTLTSQPSRWGVVMRQRINARRLRTLRTFDRMVADKGTTQMLGDEADRNTADSFGASGDCCHQKAHMDWAPQDVGVLTVSKATVWLGVVCIRLVR